jgi:hypothetical protein
MGQYGQTAIDDIVACIIRDESRKANIPDWVAMGIAGAESGWTPGALGDEVSGPTVVVGGKTYNSYRDPASGRYYSSIGLFQENICGGQGTGYSPTDLLNPRFNAQVGVPPIANAYVWAVQNGYQGTDLIRQVATHSGHPGRIDPMDPRVSHIVDVTLRLIFNPDGSWATWPPFNAAVCAGLPPPPPPIDSWSEGPAPTSRAEADAAIEAHLERVGKLIYLF